MDKLITGLGKELDCEYLVAVQNINRCYVVLTNLDITTVANIFSNPEETATLKHGDVVVEGFTSLLAILPENGNIRVNLRKE